MDPIGFGLENYDAIGRWRDKEVIEFDSPRRSAPVRTVELAIDGTGEIAGLAGGTFSDPKQIGRLLADNRACQECIVKQYFRYVSGRTETPGDRPAIRKVLGDFRKSGFRFKDMIVSMVVAREFPVQGAQASVPGNN